MLTRRYLGENSSAPTYHLPITSSDALALSYRRLVGARTQRYSGKKNPSARANTAGLIEDVWAGAIKLL